MKKRLGYVAILIAAWVVMNFIMDILTWFSGTIQLVGNCTIVMLFPLFVYVTDNWYWREGD